ncbi:MAG: site-specific integrase [Coriobacteriales bacterium]|jgi:integrase|nr:site-specific integrase [Coriobacteriales bacterium]
MGIYKTKAGYRVQVDIGALPNGKRDRKTAVCKTLREAKQAEVDLLMLRRDLRGHSNRVTLSAYIDDYFMPDKQAILRKNTIAGYRRDIELRIRPAFGGCLIGDLTHAGIQRMLSSCPTKKTATNARDTLRCILAHAKDNELIVYNPAAGRFKMPQETVKKEQFGEWVTTLAEHVEIIKKADDIETRALLVLGLCFGLRKGEVLGLDWEDVDFTSRTLRIERTYTYTLGAPDLTPPKTEESRRAIPMTDYAYGQLLKLREGGGVTHVFGPVAAHGNRRMSPKRATDLLVRFRRRNPELPHLTMTTLRHSFATAAIRSGINVASISKWLGHADVTTTLNRYVRPLLVNLKEDAKVLDEAYCRAASGA